MLFPEEDTPELKAWIVKRIENTSDADSDVLADYVIALLKHDGDLASVRKLCEEEIPDFLTEDSKAFLDDVFQTIAYKSYKKVAAPPPPRKRDTVNSNGYPDQSRTSQTHTGATASRKRGFHEREDLGLPAGGGGAVPAPGDRLIKKPRRGGAGKRGGGRGGRGRGDFGAMPPFPMMPPLDPNNPMEAVLQMQAMGLIPQLPGQERWGRPQRRKRCRDFDTKGFCSRGSTCQYEHSFGGDSVQIGTDEQTEINPNSTFLGPDGPYWQMDGAGSSPSSSRGRTDRRAGLKKRGKRAPFSTPGPTFDRSKTTIVVENIPIDSFSVEKVTEFFSQFGPIANVSMQPRRGLALVKFDSWDVANAAYESPKVIFDNRFVKVFWHREREDFTSPSAGNGDSHMSEAADAEPELDMEEFTRKQEEAQRLWGEKEVKRLELEQKRQELDKQQQDLIERHREESEKLQAKLAEKNGASSGADLLRAKLEELEQEAKILGIDPNATIAAATEDERSWSSYSPRGEPRGRGASFRGRGYMPRRRGAFRGAEGRHAAYAQYSIDNRPKKLSVTGVDFTQGEKEEVLRHFLLNLGEFKSVDAGPDATIVSFSDRKTAELFYHTLNSKELPGVDGGPLELQWVSAPSSFLSAAPKTASAGPHGGDDEENGVAGALDGHRNDGEKEEGEVDEREMNMDYDMAGDVAWDQ